MEAALSYFSLLCPLLLLVLLSDWTEGGQPLCGIRKHPVHAREGAEQASFTMWHPKGTGDFPGFFPPVLLSASRDWKPVIKTKVGEAEPVQATSRKVLRGISDPCSCIIYCLVRDTFLSALDSQKTSLERCVVSTQYQTLYSGCLRYDLM